MSKKQQKKTNNNSSSGSSGDEDEDAQKDPSSMKPPSWAMTKNNWITGQHYSDIPQWDCDTCLAFLSLSETSQHKLPGSTLTTAKVRRQVVERLHHLNLELRRQSPESVGLSLDQNALRIIIQQLSALLLHPKATVANVTTVTTASHSRP